MRRTLAALLLVLAAALAPARAAATTVTVTSPGGEVTRALPSGSGPFDVNVPLAKNSVNRITVKAVDDAGHVASRDVLVTQVSLDSVVVSHVTVERLTPEQIVQLVNEGVIDVDDPENYNVSQFTIVITIGGEPVVISVPVIQPAEDTTETGEGDAPSPDADNAGGNPPPAPQEIIVLLDEVAGPPGTPPVPLPGVLIIEGRIKSLKEFFAVRLLLLNTSGIFTLSNVTANIEFPGGGVSCTMPSTRTVAYGDILPGDGDAPGQAERQFIIRGDRIGTHPLKVSFGGVLTGPGIPEDEPIPFNGAANATVEVKGPPSFQVRVHHPDTVTAEVPYDLRIDITNTGDLPALYASLDLDVGADAELVHCTADPTTGDPACTEVPGPETRGLGHILAGRTVSQTFTVRPHTTGPVTSCVAASDQNIELGVYVGTRGCLVGHYPPAPADPAAGPTVSVIPVPNALGVAMRSPVAAFFSGMIDTASVTLGETGSFRVYDKAGAIVPGQLRFAETFGRNVAIWQAYDGVTNMLKPNAEYTVRLAQTIRDMDGKTLAAAWASSFTTTGDDFDDVTPPQLVLSVQPPADPANVLPGQTVIVEAYTSDQGSGVVRVEARLKDLDAVDGTYQLIDQKTVFAGDVPPYLFAIDSAALIAARHYQLLVTAYDAMANAQDATLSLVISGSASAPEITLPDDPAADWLQGITLDVTPLSYGTTVKEVKLYLDGAADAYRTVSLPPFQASIATLELPLGTHVVRAVAVDGLGQEGEDALTFRLIENRNMPTVDFGGAVDGAQYLKGELLTVNGGASDPVGLRSVVYWLDEVGTRRTEALARGTGPFVVPTAGLADGLHRVIAVATNRLGTSNDIADPASVLEFRVFTPVEGPPPGAPRLSDVSWPVAGLVTVLGEAAANARVDVLDVRTGLSLTVYADGNGAFSAVVSAQAGDMLRAITYDYTRSIDPSAATEAIVPAAPTLERIEVSPASMAFTAAGDWRDLTVTAFYSNATQSDVTATSSLSTSDPAVATVGGGRVVAHGNGHATILALFGGKNAACAVSVEALHLDAIEVDPAAVLLTAIGAQQQLTVHGVWSDGTNTVLDSGLGFASSDARIASVTLGGIVTAHRRGTATMTVSRTGVLPVTVPVTIDTGEDPAPTVAITGPANGTEVERGQLVSVTVLAEDEVGGVTKVFLDVTGATSDSQMRQVTPPTLATTETFTFTVSASATIGGTITVATHAQDTGSQNSAAASITLHVVDHTAPQVSVTVPLPDTHYDLGETVHIEVRATDAHAVREIRYETSGALVRSAVQAISPATSPATASFDFDLPASLPESDIYIHAYATDVSGNEGEALQVHIVALEDSTPPATRATSASAPGSGLTTTIAYEVTDGLADLDFVALFFRKDGRGTFNRYTDADGGNAEGKYHPGAGGTGTIEFNSLKTGGDGAYEFYTIGVDQAGNREADPTTGGRTVAPDVTASFAAGTVWSEITTPTVLGTGDTSRDGLNLRVRGTTLTLDGHHAFQNVELLEGARVTHPETTLDVEYGVDLAAWTVTVDATSAFDVTGRGYLGGNQPGNDCSGRTLGNAAGSSYRSGGSYGGPGGSQEGTPAATYGLVTSAADLGSGGSCGCGGYRGGDGGGRIRIAALHLVLDGALTSNGNAGSGCNAGSGAGGGVQLDVGTMSGAGFVNASGGGNEIGGGGGRIVVDYTDISTLDTAHLRALGGQGNHSSGGNGSVCLKNIHEGNGTLVVDGQNNPTSYAPLAIPPGYVFDNIVLQNQARIYSDEPIVVAKALRVESGSILTHSRGNESGLSVHAKSILVDATSAIDVDAKGYRGGNTYDNDCSGQMLGDLDGAAYRSGGSYGGYGGADGGPSNPPYGHPAEPRYLGAGGSCGCGGYSGGAGGGRVQLTATEWVKVDGAVRANGAAGRGCNAGSGSGGSIWIQTSLLRGTGSISAAGGSNEIGGSGGRIAITFDYLGPAGDNLDDTRSVTALGGHGNARWAGAGTVLFRRSDQAYGDLYVDDNVVGSTSTLQTPLTHIGFGRVVALTADTLTTDGIVPLAVNGLAGIEVNPNVAQSTTFRIVSNTATTLTVDVTGGTRLIDVAHEGDTYAGVYRFDNVYFRRGGHLVLGDKLVVSSTLRIDEYGLITGYYAAMNFSSRVDITAATLDLRPTGRIDVGGRGYLGGNNPDNDCSGQTQGNTDGAAYRSGGSHGGLGGEQEGNAGPAYDNMVDPDDMGGGGSCGCGGYSGGRGGGILRLRAQQMTVDGDIGADGASGSGCNAGSGAGGTINITTSTLSGSGAIHADGGANEIGGGGGRIAINYDTRTLPDANVRAFGGHGNARWAGEGTVWFKPSADHLGTLVIDGQGRGAPDSRSPLPEGVAYDNLILRGGVSVLADYPVTVSGTMSVLDGSRVTHTRGNERGVSLDVGSLYIDATSTIDASAKGYRGGNREGNDCSGQTLGDIDGAAQRSGGSYGGSGGVQDGSGSNGTYGLPADPRAFGSGGSCGCGGWTGGNGGGLVQIHAVNSVTVDGSISAAGQNGSGCNAAGAGGSIRIDAAHVEGSGTITAAGGANEVGGGGGRIAIYYDTWGASGHDFAATRSITAAGGKGNARWASAGTVLLKRNDMALAELYIDENHAGSFAGVYTSPPRLGVGRVAALTADTLTTDGHLALLPNALVGYEINPNTAQQRTFRIVSNTADSVTVDVTGGTTLTDVAHAADAYTGVATYDSVYLRRGAGLILDDRLVVTSTLSIAETSSVTHHDATLTDEPRLDVTAGSLFIESGSGIDVTGRGYLGGNREGNDCSAQTFANADGSTYRSAGSYGGSGGADEGTPNATYGVSSDPFELGSGGSCGCGGYSGGDGGGRVLLHAADATIDGVISADGNSGNGCKAGSGSGGAINLTVATLSGTGSIHASGAAHEIGGGGGRVAIHYHTMTLPAGNVTAGGGHGNYGVGQDGTVVLDATP